MNIVVTGVSHRTAPIAVREKFTFRQTPLPQVLISLLTEEEVLECVVLSTCDRVELSTVLATEDVERARELLLGCVTAGLDSDPRMHRYLYPCGVCSGLRSMIVGEPQIFGQVRKPIRWLWRPALQELSSSLDFSQSLEKGPFFLV
jgi:glutamyl-tRNA reductase